MSKIYKKWMTSATNFFRTVKRPWQKISSPFPLSHLAERNVNLVQ